MAPSTQFRLDSLLVGLGLMAVLCIPIVITWVIERKVRRRTEDFFDLARRRNEQIARLWDAKIDDSGSVNPIAKPSLVEVARPAPSDAAPEANAAGGPDGISAGAVEFPSPQFGSEQQVPDTTAEPRRTRAAR